MDRTLQSALEKRTRVGAWSSRVYRLERGYLSTWSDARLAAKEQPSRTECLFQDKQVAVLTDQGDRKFKLEFPWDGSKNLSLRANNTFMKRSWVELLKATLKEATLQIEGTGSVFAYGGAAHHEEDRAYEEAAFLKTNRFVAAYVVDEQNRASYINDLLNEGFHRAGERSGGGREVHRACAGANAAVEELLALTSDFNEEMRGVDELWQGRGGDSGVLDPSVAAPKIQRFCEEYLSLAGRLVSSRLMLELSPFMDSSVAGTPSAPTSSTRDELVATRRKLDEAYAVADRQVVFGTQDWFMDIRASFLDCDGLAHASSIPPPPTPEVSTQPDDESTAATGTGITASPPQEDARPGLVQRTSKGFVSNALSAARTASMGASWTNPSSSAKEKDAAGSARLGHVAQSTTGAVSMRDLFRRGSRSEKEQSGLPLEGTDTGAGSEQGVHISSGGRSIRGMFKRGSRSEKEPPGIAKETPADQCSQQSFVSSSSPAGHSVPGVNSTGLVPAYDEGRERSDLFGGSSKSPGKSPGTAMASARLPPSPPRRNIVGGSPALPLGGGGNGNGGVDVPKPSSLSQGGDGESQSKGRRAFAGGMWGAGSSAATQVSRGTADPPRTSSVQELDTGTKTEEGETPLPEAHASDGIVAVPAKPKPSGGKRRFAGGGLSAAPPPPPPPPRNEVYNPFGESAKRSESLAGIPSGVAKQDASIGWATGGGDDSVPGWLAGGDGRTGAPGDNASFDHSREAKSNGFGLAPPSRVDQGQEVAMKSPFLAAEEPAPPTRRPSQRRPGEAGRSKRAFGGGESVF